MLCVSVLGATFLAMLLSEDSTEHICILSSIISIQNIFVFFLPSSPYRTYLYSFFHHLHTEHICFLSSIISIQNIFVFFLPSSPYRTYLYSFFHHLHTEHICILSSIISIQNIFVFFLPSSPFAYPCPSWPFCLPHSQSFVVPVYRRDGKQLTWRRIPFWMGLLLLEGAGISVRAGVLFFLYFFISLFPPGSVLLVLTGLVLMTPVILGPQHTLECTCIP